MLIGNCGGGAPSGGDVPIMWGGIGDPLGSNMVTGMPGRYMKDCSDREGFVLGGKKFLNPGMLAFGSI